MSEACPLHHHLFNSSLFAYLGRCFYAKESTYLFTAFSILNITLVLPLSILVLLLGVRRWRRQRSSHSDVVTYHMAAMEHFGVSGNLLYCFSVYAGVLKPMVAAAGFIFITLLGQTLFHSLTCVERYLAVVHPVTYLGLRNGAGVRIRNASVGCVWLLCFGLTGLMLLDSLDVIIVLYLIIVHFCFLVVCICSSAVLCTLNRPAPGQRVRDRERVDHSKKRAFYTIMVIMAALVMRTGGHLGAFVLHSSPLISDVARCLIIDVGMWFSLPSSAVLPLLFLHRAGKLHCCKNGTESRPGSG